MGRETHFRPELAGLKAASAWRPWASWLTVAALFAIFAGLTPFDFRAGSNPQWGPEADQAVLEAARTVDKGQAIRQVLIATLGLMSAAALFMPGRRVLAASRPAALAGAGFLFTALASPIWSDDPGLTVRRVFVLLVMSSLAIAVSRLWDAREVLAGIIVGMMAFLLASLCVEVAAGTFTPLDSTYRFAGLVHPNGMALSCGILVVGAVVGGSTWPSWRGRLAIVAVVSGAALLMTKSRGGAAGALFALLCVAGVRYRRSRLLPVVIGVVVCGTLITVLLVGGDLKGAITQGVSMGRQDNADIGTFTGRVTLWGYLWRFVQDSPFLGYGYDSFWVPRRMFEIVASQGWVMDTAHSGYLEMVLGLGMVGSAPFFVLLMAVPVQLLRRYRSTQDVTDLAAFGIIGLILVNMIVESILFAATIPSLTGLVIIASALFVRPRAGHAPTSNIVPHLPVGSMHEHLTTAALMPTQ